MQAVDVVIGGAVAPEGVLRIVQKPVGLRMVQQPGRHDCVEGFAEQYQPSAQPPQRL